MNKWKQKDDKGEAEFTLGKFIGIVIAVIAVVVIINFVSKWGKAASDVVSPDNVKDQYDRVITDWESLYSAAENACLATSSGGENSPVLVESPEQAYAATFRKIVVDYNARQQDIFKAGLVGPPGYPDSIPRSLGTDDWCSVPEELDALRN